MPLWEEGLFVIAPLVGLSCYASLNLRLTSSSTRVGRTMLWTHHGTSCQNIQPLACTQIFGNLWQITVLVPSRLWLPLFCPRVSGTAGWGASNIVFDLAHVQLQKLEDGTALATAAMVPRSLRYESFQKRGVSRQMSNTLAWWPWCIFSMVRPTRQGIISKSQGRWQQWLFSPSSCRLRE